MSEHIKPYSQEENKKGQVSKMFDNIAPYYDFLNRFLSLGIDTIWRKKAINELKAIDPKKILDVATGTGDVAIEMTKRLTPTEIIGLDISKEMLEVGKKKIKKRNLSNIIKMEVGDSENLRFEDNTFDAITVAFGVRNFENLEKGIAEMNRVLKKDGKLIVLEFSRPSIFPIKQAFNFYFKYILPLIGRLTSKDKSCLLYTSDAADE